MNLSQNARRTTRPQPATHLFAIGETVRMKANFQKTADIYHITARLPAMGDELQYRIRNHDERHERVTTQSNLEAIDPMTANRTGTLIEKTFGNSPTTRPIPSQVRSAIATFLNECQKEARPFATIEALSAIRSMFPDLDVSDSELEDALSSAAAKAGFDVDGASRTTSTPRTEAQRLIDNDTSGTRRRANAIKDRNRLI